MATATIDRPSLDAPFIPCPNLFKTYNARTPPKKKTRRPQSLKRGFALSGASKERAQAPGEQKRIYPLTLYLSLKSACASLLGARLRRFLASSRGPLLGARLRRFLAAVPCGACSVRGYAASSRRSRFYAPSLRGFAAWIGSLFFRPRSLRGYAAGSLRLVGSSLGARLRRFLAYVAARSRALRLRLAPDFAVWRLRCAALPGALFGLRPLFGLGASGAPRYGRYAPLLVTGLHALVTFLASKNYIQPPPALAGGGISSIYYCILPS